MELPRLTTRNLAILLVALVVAGLAYKRWSAPRHGTPEAAIAAMLDDGAAAARAGRVGDMMKHVSQAYRGDDSGGPATRDELRAYLAVALAQGGEARFVSRDIEVQGAEAVVRAAMVLAFGGLRGIGDGRTGAREVELQLVYEDGAWRVVSGRLGALVDL